jgi:hypothetical protein
MRGAKARLYRDVVGMAVDERVTGLADGCFVKAAPLPRRRRSKVATVRQRHLGADLQRQRDRCHEREQGQCQDDQ